MLISVIKFLFKIIFIYLPILILFLLLLASISKLRFKIKYKYKKDINIFSFEIFLWKIKIIKFEKDFNKPSKKKRTVSKRKRKNKLALIPDSLSYVLKIFHVIELEEVEELSTIVNFGAGESHYTAILSGYIYAIVGSLYSLIHNYKKKVKRTDKKVIKVNCFFNEFKFEMLFNCIVRAKGANIIKVIYMIVKQKLKERKMEGNKNERTSYSGAYEHSNAKY